MALVADDPDGNMPPWIDTEFLQKILRESTHDDGLTVEKFSSRTTMKKGDNYGSDMYRVEVSVRRGDGQVNTRSLIVKLPPSSEEMNRILTEGGVFKREISIYDDILPRIAELLGEKGPFPAALYTRVDPSALLVLEDLSVEGYLMGQRTKGLDLKQASICLKMLGRFHAASVSLLHSEPSLLQPYRTCVFNEPGLKESMKNFLGSSLRTLAEEVESWPDVGADYATRLRKLMPTALEKLLKSFELDSQDFPVLAHGDLWVNNMLFHYNDTGEVDDVKLVDFPCAVVASPAIDLDYFLCTSLPDELRREHSEHLLRGYHSSLCDTMDKLGLSQHKPSFEHILQDCDRKAFHAMYCTITEWPVVVFESEDGFDVESAMTGVGGESINVWSNKAINAVIRRLLPEFEKKGLF